MDIICSADYVIDLGPDGGNSGGRVVACGTPAELAASGKGYTALAIRDYLQELEKCDRKVKDNGTKKKKR